MTNNMWEYKADVITTVVTVVAWTNVLEVGGDIFAFVAKGATALAAVLLVMYRWDKHKERKNEKRQSKKEV